MYKRKLILVLLGGILSLIIIEFGLRLGGFAYVSFQDYKNRLAIRKKEVFRVLCLGESTTALGGNDSYPSQLQDVLNKNNIGVRFAVINGGMAGIRSDGIVDKLEDDIKKYDPDIVITMMGINDIDEVMPYGPRDKQETNSFLKHFRAYKLFKIFYAHVVSKKSEIINRRFYQDIPSVENKEHYFNLAEQYKQKGLYREAEILYKNLLNIEPDNWKIYFDLASLYRDSGLYVEAEKFYRRALDIDPHNDVAYAELACFLHNRLSKNLEPIELCKKALSINPENWTAYYVLGECYEAEGMNKEALKSYNRMLDIDVNKDLTLSFLGNFYLKLEQPDEAVKFFIKAININPTNDRWYRGAALCFRILGKEDLAKDYFSKAKNIRVQYFNYKTSQNYKNLKQILDRHKIKLVCVQYPNCSIELLKFFFDEIDDIVFVDNEAIFKSVIMKDGYGEYFMDNFGGDFGHCTRRGNRLLAENIAKNIIEIFFGGN